MVPEIWNVKDRIFLSLWANVCPLTPLATQKIKTFKKWKKPSRDSIFFKQVYQKSWSYATLFLRLGDGCNFYFSFWSIFCPFTHLTAQKIKILKKWNKQLRISSIYTCVPKIMIRWCMVPEIWCVTDGRADGRMYGRKKWHRRLVPHLIKTSYIRARFLSIYLKIGATWGRL